MATYEEVLDRLADKFTVGDGCWQWRVLNSEGYGTFRVDGAKKKAHRVLYELMVGPIPEGLDLDHLCRNRGCVRPDHLEPVTRGENQRRGVPYRTPRDCNPWGRRVTHCPRGHEYTPENIRGGQGNRRSCLICHRERMAEYRRVKREVS